MHPLLDRLNRDHRSLARLLTVLDRTLDRFHQGAEPDYELLCELLEYMDSYADTIHHPTEDLIFRRLMDVTGESPEVLGILMHQHQEVVQLNRRFRGSLDGIVHDDVLTRDEVEVQGRDLVRALWNHMTLEDTQAFPLAQERLSQADWEEVARVAPNAADPVFGAPDPTRFRALFEQLAAEVGVQTRERVPVQLKP
jgi:hemerythrin-like domain-containing protein